MAEVKTIAKRDSDTAANGTKYADYVPGGKSAYVFDPARGELAEGMTIDAEQLERLATWMCANMSHKKDDLQKRHQEEHGFCLECAQNAGWMILMCPYIDMTREPQK